MMRPPPPERTQKTGRARFGGERAAVLVPRRHLSGPVPWVIAIMIALVVIAAAGGLALGNLAKTARGELSGAVTVQIIEANSALREEQAVIAAQLLAQDPAVESLRTVPQAELDELLEPWLGTAEAGNPVPIPALIDVQLRRAASEAEIARLQSLLKRGAPAARVDAQSHWLQPVYSALSAMQYLALTMIALLLLTSVAAVWLAARSSFANHRDTVEIVHLLGGTDKQIARIFQRSVAIDAMLGGIVGLALGAAASWLIARQFSGLESGMVSAGSLAPVDWFVIALIPLLGVGIAMLTARITVTSALRRML
ncbi:FtsX-like permease family protein [Erythrobacteraceae bacterium E2-1 Yellow Sea]|nr:FtsX-like permease family protein [Erythrobacteraceae bacterium E2-1 Yellow Sea]